MSYRNNLQRKSLIKRFSLIFGLAMVVAFYIIGILMLTNDNIMREMDPKYKTGMAIVILCYGTFRLFRTYYSFISNREEEL